MVSEGWGLEGRTVLVLGAGGGGIGPAIARRLGRAGAAVAAVDVDGDKLAVCTDALGTDGVEHLGIVADGRDAEAVDAAVGRAAELGPLHGSVQVAGGIWPPQWSPFAGDDPAFDDVVALNLGATVNTVRAVGRRLVAQGTGGAIVNISTISALTAFPYAHAYAAAKAAVLSLTRSLAVEWGRVGIRVNAVAPGSIDTPKSESVNDPGAEAQRRRDDEVIPMRRRGTPDDIAAPVLFLMSDLAGYVTGQVLAVDGGVSVRPAVNDGDELPVFVHNDELRARLLGG